MKFRRVLPQLFLSIFLFSRALSCAKREETPAPEAAEAAAPEADAGTFPFFPPDALAAVLRPGEAPLWFDASGGSVEAGSGGPVLAGGIRAVDSPGQAELAPFTPWPLARHAAAALVWEGALYLALNRDSMLVFLPLEGGDLGLYRLTCGSYWESFTPGNLFLYRGRPSVFFFRDHIFAEPAAPPPDPPVLTLIPGVPGTPDPFARLEPLELPALAGIPPAENWEVDILRPGADGLWYYRLIRPRNGGREARYFRASDLSGPGEEVDPGLYRSSQQEGPKPESFGLPPLPENFAYTHVVRLGDLIIAAWEEQQDYNIGAAGFMVLRGAPAELSGGETATP
jgi:hypothetical protein